MHHRSRPTVFARQDETDIPVRVPVYARIQHEIRRGILSGAYASGDRIPSETELAQHFQTTRATVARALQELVFDGTIVRRVGAGSFVAPGAAAVSLESKRLRSFEEQAAETGETVDYRVVDFSPVPILQAAAARLRVAPGSKAYRLERLRSIRGVPLSFETRLIPEEIGARIAVADLASRSIHHILQVGLGLTIARIEASVRAGTATPRVARLLELQKGRPLLIRDHVLVGSDDRPILSGASFYTEQFRLDYVVHGGTELSR
ncbi:MAG TPA: GntR family transcriptional regulator [Stellaceae bacterium]|nr:GntR family transcriptional regulator [Stellaceae bacterium]